MALIGWEINTLPTNIKTHLSLIVYAGRSPASPAMMALQMGDVSKLG
jgi:hypothetical protein